MKFLAQDFIFDVVCIPPVTEAKTLFSLGYIQGILFPYIT